MYKTRVYTQYVGGSGLDARYIGTVNESPKVIAEQLRKVKGIVTVHEYGEEVLAFGLRPY